MNLILGTLIEGAILAAIWMVVMLIARPRIARAGHAALLVVAALFYVRFAIEAGAYSGLAIELIGTAIFAAIALKGFRSGGNLLAWGWALHPVWDVALHTGPLGEYAPLGYVVSCVSFDLLVAAFVWRTLREARTPAAALA